jgi:hypothetical protein
MSADKVEPTRPQVQAARQAFAESRQGRIQARDYALVVRQLPMLLQRHGLGQALAYLQLRGGGNLNSPYELVARQMDRWLFSATGVAGRNFLGVLSGRDSRFYREATEHAWLFARALGACLEENKP